jgi:2-keto-4-pentenoate hydratase/2-oxohepta-3-ene-1,7-dioic acid hydratase in catechol pathway
MKLYLGLTESAAPDETRIFAECENQLIDLKLAYAAKLIREQGQPNAAYELGGFYFPKTIGEFLQRGEQARDALDQVVAFVRESGTDTLRGPMGEKLTYPTSDIRLLPPFRNPEKSFVIGFSERARAEVTPQAEIPTGYYKLPQTFITNGDPIVWPKFSDELDADACLAIVIGKAGRRIPPEEAWNHVVGATLLIDITARDINKREGLTTNNLLGKNFPSSTSLGPAFVLVKSRQELESVQIELSLDNSVKQKFTLDQCVFTVEQIIARWSILGIKPGDFLAIGASMALQGGRLGNPVVLRTGSTIACSSPAIGELSHQVVRGRGPTR